MQNEFRNEAWQASEERELYLKTLQTIRSHKPLERLGPPTTTLLFISGKTDLPIRQLFEESSRHFKTYNLYTDISGFFTGPDNVEVPLTNTPVIFLNLLDLLSRVRILRFISGLLTPSQKAHLSYRKFLRSLGPDEIADRIAELYQMIGLTNFTKLNVIIASKDNKNVRFGVKYLCKVLDDIRVKHHLANKNVQVPEGYQTAYGFIDYQKCRLKYHISGPVQGVNKSLLQFLVRKTSWVMEKIRLYDLMTARRNNGKKILILGRRPLTRGLDVLNEISLVQSYDYQFDIGQKLLLMLLKSSLKSFRHTGTHALIVVESFPEQVSRLLSKDDELRSLLNGNEFALACVEPETKNIYAFKGDQFILKTIGEVS